MAPRANRLPGHACLQLGAPMPEVPTPRVEGGRSASVLLELTAKETQQRFAVLMCRARLATLDDGSLELPVVNVHEDEALCGAVRQAWGLVDTEGAGVLGAAGLGKLVRELAAKDCRTAEVERLVEAVTEQAAGYPAAAAGGLRQEGTVTLADFTAWWEVRAFSKSLAGQLGVMEQHAAPPLELTQPHAQQQRTPGGGGPGAGPAGAGGIYLSSDEGRRGQVMGFYLFRLT